VVAAWWLGLSRLLLGMRWRRALAAATVAAAARVFGPPGSAGELARPWTAVASHVPSCVLLLVAASGLFCVVATLFGPRL